MSVKTDAFALGVVLLELLTGARPITTGGANGANGMDGGELLWVVMLEVLDDLPRLPAVPPPDALSALPPGAVQQQGQHQGQQQARQEARRRTPQQVWLREWMESQAASDPTVRNAVDMLVMQVDPKAEGGWDLEQAWGLADAARRCLAIKRKHRASVKSVLPDLQLLAGGQAGQAGHAGIDVGIGVGTATNGTAPPAHMTTDAAGMMVRTTADKSGNLATPPPMTIENQGSCSSAEVEFECSDCGISVRYCPPRTAAAAAGGTNTSHTSQVCDECSLDEAMRTARVGGGGNGDNGGAMLAAGSAPLRERVCDCGNMVLGDDKFCTQCGVRVAPALCVCGSSISNGHVFCTDCGVRLTPQSE
jgi:hypothetical protein